MKKIISSFLLLLSSFSYGQDISFNIKVLNRIGYGPTQESLKNIDTKGYSKWINEQIDNPNLYNDNNVLSQIKNLSIEQQTPFQIYQKHDGYLNANKTPFEGYPNGIFYENFKKKVIYDLYSENRLREMMTYFWFNHFSINGRNNQGSLSLLNDYNNQIRENSFGKFKNLLKVTSHHPAMLRYLNNTENKSPNSIIDKNHTKLIRKKEHGDFFESESYGYNENYAREFLELHTMGVNSGYTQNDIQELAKVLTGFGMADFYSLNKYIDLDVLRNIDEQKLKTISPYKFNYSLFSFKKNEHDFSTKIFLGHKIKGSGEKELDEVIDIVSKNPHTAEFLSKKIAAYFLGEVVDNSIVLKMKEEYLKTDGDISSVLRVLLNSQEFLDSINKQDKYKDTYSYYLSSYKLLFNGEKIDDFGFFFNKLNELDLGIFNKITPEGYSLKGSDYISSQILLKNNNFTKTMLYFPTEIKYDFNSIDYNLINKINPSIKNKEDLYLFLVSIDWKRK